MEDIVNFDTLLSLIDDRDEEVYIAVKNRLIEAGPNILPVLEHALTTSISLLQHDRLEQIIKQLRFVKLEEKMAIWVNSEEKSLLDGWILISTIHHPSIVSNVIELLVQKIVRDVWVEINESLTSIEQVSILNHIFYDLYRFELNQQDIYAPENSVINNLLISRKGNLLSLSTLYCIVAQRLHLPIHPIGVGQYIVLGYYEPQIAKEVYGANTSPYLFYINIEHQGAIIGANELAYFVHQNKLDIKINTPISEGKMIKLLLEFMIKCYDLKGEDEKLKTANNLMDKLQKY